MTHYARSKRAMSGDTLETMHRLNDKEVWRARCWKCRTWNEAVRSQLCTCKVCGVNLWKRNETR